MVRIKGGLNVAIQTVLVLMVTEVPDPVAPQPGPLNPAKDEPTLGVAVSVTRVPKV